MPTSDPRSSAPATTVRRSPRSRGVAAALAAALLAGASTAWVTRPSDAASAAVSGGTGTAVLDTAATSTAVTGTAVRATPALGDPETPPPPPRPGSPRRSEPAATPAAPPDRLRVERLGIDLAVVPVGVSRDGQMALPPTPAQVGWYRFGPRPGDRAGAVVLAAHLDMPGYGVGPIAAIEKLHPRDLLTVRSAGVVRRYAVTSVSKVPKSTLDLAALFSRDGPARLHLVTCGGAFDHDRHRYEDNIVLSAKLVT